MAAQPAAARYAAIVVDAASGTVLHAANPDTRNHPASLTKMMTLYLVFDAIETGKLKLDQRLPVSRRATGQAPSRLGLKRGQIIAVKDIINALVTKSANDAATVVAEALGGTEAKFARLMTEKAKALGMTRTTFRNASGLPNRRQLSTARDMATLALALMRDFPNHYHFFARSRFTYGGRTHKNHNKLLKTYPGTDGVKTGYIRASGFNLVASTERAGRRLVGVVFGGRSGKSRDRQMARLLDNAFDSVSNGRIARVMPQIEKRRALKKKSTNRRKPRRAKNRRNRWGIQVGAFARFAPAHLAATRAARKAPRLLRRTRVKIIATEGPKGKLYKARLFGLSKARAKRVCRILKSKKHSCEPIAPAGRKTVGAAG